MIEAHNTPPEKVTSNVIAKSDELESMQIHNVIKFLIKAVFNSITRYSEMLKLSLNYKQAALIFS